MLNNFFENTPHSPTRILEDIPQSMTQPKDWQEGFNEQFPFPATSTRMMEYIQDLLTSQHNTTVQECIDKVPLSQYFSTDGSESREIVIGSLRELLK